MIGKMKIEVSQEVREKIKKTLGVSNVMVSYALNYDEQKGHSALAKRIRKMAIINGGRRMAYLPAFETAFCHNGIMTQEFDNGATLTADMQTGRVEVKDPKGVLRKVSENATIPELYVLQNMAMTF